MAKKTYNFYDTMDFPAYQMREYPKVLYAPNGDSITVANATEERSLGEGWYESPSAAKAAKPKPTPPPAKSAA